MNSERRHELQQNDLAIYLDRVNRSIEPYSKIIAAVVVVIFVVAIGWGFYRTMESEERSNATLELIQAKGTRDAETLLAVSEAYPDTAAGAWARLYQGQQYLLEGIQSLYTQRDEAEQLLDDAQVAFNAAIANSDDPLLRSRAYFGIARASESLGNLDEAVAAYESVIELSESEAMVEKSQLRIDTLSGTDAKDFINWFAQQDFTPPDPSMPPSMPGSNTIPDLPDFNLPGLDLNTTPGGSEGDSEGDSEAAMPPDGGLQLPETPGDDVSGDDVPGDEAAVTDEDATDEDAVLEVTTTAGPAETTPESEPAAENTDDTGTDDADSEQPAEEPSSDSGEAADADQGVDEAAVEDGDAVEESSESDDAGSTDDDGNTP